MEKTEPLFINIADRNNVFDLLSKLSPDTIPAFGTLTPQHMIEHLIVTIRYSNVKINRQLTLDEARANQAKAVLIYTDTELPKGFKSPLMPKEGLPPLEFDNLTDAIRNLNEELEKLEHYFIENPEETTTNPFMGELQYKEWLVFHGKHFTHHFKQFGLI